MLAEAPRAVAPARRAPAAAQRLALGCALMLVEVEAACRAQGCSAGCPVAVSTRSLAVSAAGLASDLEIEYDGAVMEARL